MADTAQTPLLGVILCCTSIPPEKRSDLAAMATQMGAVHKLDLTSDVTHLIVGDTDTPKYKFVAKERPDVLCLLPSFIEAVREKWLEGGDLKVGFLEVEHKLPTFTSLRICLTGFEDLVYRKALEDLINANGGEYRGNLTKDVTHLVAMEPSGAKYTYASHWGIKTVAVEWLEQSVERGMILEENLFNLLLPVAERGQGAWNHESTSSTSLKRAQQGDSGPQNARKLRRTASARLSSTNSGLWTDIFGGDVKAEGTKPREWDDEHDQSLSRYDTIKTLNKSIDPGSEALRVESEDKIKNAEDGGKSAFGRLPQRERLFNGRSFLLRGFDQKKTAILQEHLRSHGADIIEDTGELETLQAESSPDGPYLLVPHSSPQYDVPTTPDVAQRPIVVTEFWIERCLYKKEFEQPQDNVVSTPFRRFPIAGFEHMTVCSTAFQGIDLVHMSKAVKLMGAKYEEFFTPNASVLVCNAITPGHEKLRHAQLWGVSAVTASWLWDCIREGELMPFGSYLVQAVLSSDQSPMPSDMFIQRDSSVKARKNDSTLESFDNKLKKAMPPPEEYKRPAKDGAFTPRASRSSIDSRPNASFNAGTKLSSCKETQNSKIDKTEELLPPFEVRPDDDDDSPNTIHAPTPGPLHEISPNSSPRKRSVSPTKPSISPKKAPSPQPQKQSSISSSSLDHHDDSLGPTISSLLAHHQRTSSNAPPLNSSDPTRMCRRRRQLFGRAPSNLSSHSNINLSRASSVDTMNTDGLGTPLESSGAQKVAKSEHSNMIAYSMDHQDDPDREEPPLQMTQLGYEDPDVAAWRERVAIKMDGGKVKGATPGKKGGGVKDEISGKSLGIAKRTRLASGGR